MFFQTSRSSGDKKKNALYEPLMFVLHSSFNFTFVVSSDLGGEVRVPSTASLVWPDLVPNDEKIVTLTPTNVGNTSVSCFY